jgi:hypothetical protein
MGDFNGLDVHLGNVARPPPFHSFALFSPSPEATSPASVDTAGHGELVKRLGAEASGQMAARQTSMLDMTCLIRV